MSLLPGDKLSHYEILAALGAGGMGEVYRAKDTKLGRQVAIKVLPGHLAADTSARERLRREALAAAALDHPFICKVFEIGEQDSALFLVMEFIAGDTLHRRLRSGTLPIPEALRISGEVAEALEEAHNHRFVHRDLKPANVMLTTGGHAKVMDFGLAKKFAATPLVEDAATATMAEPSLTEMGMALGTPDYMSPEQVRGEALDQRSDVFSFGILLCDLLGSPHPFRRNSQTETMAAILRDPPNLSGDLPQGLMVLIRRLLAKSRDGRYQSMADVRADLDRLTASALTPEPQKQPEGRIPLIGRDAERKELLLHLEDALAGGGSMVIIGGEPGIGKTHLVTAILEEARRRGAYANIGHCYEMEGAPPYVPFIEMLEHTARVAPRETFRLALGDAASEVAKLMPELRRMYPDIPPAIQLPAEQQRRFLFNAYREFIERAAKVTPIVHVFEDLHWADEPTLLLLQHLAQMLSTTPMLVIGTYRDVELDVNRPFAKTLETLVRRQKQATRMTLRRLPLGGVGCMLAAMSGQTPPPSLARVVFEETEGNPFFVEEVFRHLSEEGRLFDEAGTWRQGLRVDQLQVPEGVRLVLGRRLERLGEDARRVLTTASVIGRSFSLRLLEELENSKPDAALDAVEEAERAHIVVAEPAGRDTRYRFVHELIRQTLAETSSLPRRQRLHARVAEAIERVYSANLEAHASALAHHLYQAGAAADPDKTTTYLMLAAQQARAGAAHEEALTHLENALSLWEGERSVRVAELMEQRAGALEGMGRSEEAADSYGKAIALFESAGAVARAAGASLALTMLRVWRNEIAAGRLAAERALERLGSANPHLRMSLLQARAGMLSAGGDAATAVGLLEEARALREAAEGPRLTLTCDHMEAHSRWHMMQLEQLVIVARRASETYRARGDLWTASDAECFVGMEIFLGRTAEAAEGLAGALTRAERVGHHGAVWGVKWMYTFLSAARGDPKAAGKASEDAWNFGEAHQIAWNFCIDTSRGQYAFLRGEFAEAERWFRYRPENGEKTFMAGWAESSLFAALAETNDDRAWKAWTDHQWKSPLIGQPNHVGAWVALERSVIGLAWLGKTDEVAALRSLTEDLVLTAVWTFSYLSPFRTAAGIAAACAGDWSAAEQHHLTAIHQTDTAPYRISQPTAREWYAAMLLDRKATGDATKARVLLSEALAMYESLGMAFHANRTSGRLAAL